MSVFNYIVILCVIIAVLAFALVLSLLRVSSKPLPLPLGSDAPFEKPMGLSPLVEWTDMERAHFASFLASPVGQAFMIRARHVEADTAKRQCQDTMTTAHSAGIAAGFSECLKWIESMAKPISGASAVQDAQTATGTQDDAAPAEYRRSF